jgi:hypothetical protein
MIKPGRQTVLRAEVAAGRVAEARKRDAHRYLHQLVTQHSHACRLQRRYYRLCATRVHVVVISEHRVCPKLAAVMSKYAHRYTRTHARNETTF